MQPDKISYFYIDTIDDLSFARTHYPHRLVRRYLNGISQVLSLKIYKSQRVYWKNIVRFWKTELPLAMYEARREFLISFIILAVSVGIGIFSASHDPSFANYILGNDYVAKTQANIDKGDPMAVYKENDQAKMFLSITYNNIYVSVRTYLLSLFFGIGTLLIIIYNGIVLGAFQYYFIERGLFFESFLTVWQHGTIEISCIVLAGAAGLVLARGVLFPGTYSRLDAFRYAGRKSLTIMLGLMPLLVYSGAVEGFMTRYTDMPWVVRLSTILLSLGFVLSYFVWYPRKVARTDNLEQKLSLFLQPVKMNSFSFRAIEKTPSIFWQSFLQLFAAIKQWLVMVTILLAIIIFAILFESNSLTKSFNHFRGYTLWDFFHTGQNYYLMAFNFMLVFAGSWWGIRLSCRSAAVEIPLTITANRLRKVTFIYSLSSAIIASLALSNAWVSLSLFILFSFTSILVNYMLVNNTGLKDAIAPVFDTLGKNLQRLLGLLITYVFFGILLGVLIQGLISELLWVFLSNIVINVASMPKIYLVVSSIIILVPLLVFYTILFSILTLSFFSITEINSAQSLMRRIDELFPAAEGNGDHKAAILNFRKFE